MHALIFFLTTTGNLHQTAFGEEHYEACYWAVWIPYHHSEKTQIEMIWAHNKINRTCKGDPTGHGTRREKERETGK